MPDLDVAVVGAGAAGLAAGVELQAAGVRFAVFEAAGRVGGRAFTDATTFSQPWDLGCHWLHSADINPFTAIADRLGRTYLTHARPLLRHIHLGTRWASPAQTDDAARALDAALEAITAAGQAGRDVAASTVLPDAGPWHPLVNHWLSLITAAIPEDISTADYAAYADTGRNWPVPGGYGALVAAHAAHVPVTLQCPVTRIDRSGTTLVLATPRGDVRARQAIVTLPTPVLARGTVAFHPALPVALQEAFAALPLGVVEKVAIGFTCDPFGYGERTGISTVHQQDAGGTPVNFQILPDRQALAVAHFAGEPAAALVAEGAPALVEAALAALARVFGHDIRRHVARTRVTGWTRDPLIGGGYSCALPGQAALRARLSESFDPRLHFAGEAVSRNWFSTCHGAHLTGLAAARAALEALRRQS